MIKNIFFVVFLISTIAFAKITVGDKPISFNHKKFPDQYQCSAQKNSNVVGILTDTDEYLLQAVATSDRNGLREVSGVISDHSALFEINHKRFMDTYTMPPISGEGMMKQVPQGVVWSSVSQMSEMANAQLNGTSVGKNMPYEKELADSKLVAITKKLVDGLKEEQEVINKCTGMSCTGTYFNSYYRISDEKKEADMKEYFAAVKEYEEILAKRKKELQARAEAEAKLKYPEPDPNDKRTGGRAAREKLPGQIAAETKRAGDNVEKLKAPGELPGTIAAKQTLPGHAAGQEKLPGHIAGQEPIPGRAAGFEVKPGDKIHYDSIFEKKVPRVGENIGNTGITTFSAIYDTQGNLKKVVYRTGREITKIINAGDKNVDPADPIIAKIKAQTKRFQTYAGCCKNDSRKECVIKHEPEIKPSVAPPGIPHDHGPDEPGGAVFNPFGGSR